MEIVTKEDFGGDLAKRASLTQLDNSLTVPNDEKEELSSPTPTPKRKRDNEMNAKSSPDNKEKKPLNLDLNKKPRSSHSYKRHCSGEKHKGKDLWCIRPAKDNGLCFSIHNFGSPMACVRADVMNNIMKLEARYFSNPSTYTNLYTIANDEIASKSSRNSSSCTNALVWLNRSMDFMVQLFSNLLEHPEWPMTHACSDAYKKTLKKWHGWVAVSTFKVIMKLAPERKKFMESIGANSDVDNADIKMLCSNFAPILEENHQFLASVGVSDIKAP